MFIKDGPISCELRAWLQDGKSCFQQQKHFAQSFIPVDLYSKATRIGKTDSVFIQRLFDFNPCATFRIFFCPFSFFVVILPVIGSCIKVCILLEFYYFDPISFNKSILHLVQKIVQDTFGPKRPHWNPLKLLFLITVPFNCKIMLFLHSVGKA